MTIIPVKYTIKKAKIIVDRDPVVASLEKWTKPGHFSRTLRKGPISTRWVWNLHSDVHDFDAHTSDIQEVSRKVFGSHFGHIGIILIWLSAGYFHGARFSNYETWILDPIHFKPSAQVVWPIVGQEILNADVGGGFQGIQITSGLFQLWRSRGLTNGVQLYTLAVSGLLIRALIFFAGWFHYHSLAPKLRWFQNVESIINHHLAGILGLGSLAWAGHQIHVSRPINCLLDAGIDSEEIPLPHEWLINCNLISQIYPSFSKGLGPIFRLKFWIYKDLITFQGGLNPVTGGLWLTDESHHHLAIGVLLIVRGHMYRTNWGVGHSILELLEAHQGPITGVGHKGLYGILTTSWHAQLALNLAILGSLSIVVRHHIYSMPPYPYQSIDYRSQLSLFTHHLWIGGRIIVGAGAHASIFIVRDYDMKDANNNLVDRVIRQRDVIISHLNWVCIFLGLHSFGLYIHNDSISAIGRPYDIFSDTAIQIQPIFAQYLQKIHSLAPQVTVPVETVVSSITWGEDLVIVGGKVALIPVSLGTADFIIHHIHAFTIHVTVLILLKGVIFSRSSRLIPDKANFGFRFPCDGPGRGGTCQVSSWDHIFLGLFWMYNSISIVIFHFSWKIQSDVWGTITNNGVAHITGGNFRQSANTVNGWLRDFLWAQSSQVIQSYGSPLSAYGLIFLGAHFIWAFSLIFLFSGRGYWQELIESILWAHNKLDIAPNIQPRALSITQGRAVGVAHYLLGGVATTWAFFLARIISVG
jgi:photosystem I P700 chlorophyll a apoprotein A1